MRREKIETTYLHNFGSAIPYHGFTCCLDRQKQRKVPTTVVCHSVRPKTISTYFCGASISDCKGRTAEERAEVNCVDPNGNQFVKLIKAFSGCKTASADNGKKRSLIMYRGCRFIQLGIVT